MVAAKKIIAEREFNAKIVNAQALLARDAIEKLVSKAVGEKAAPQLKNLLGLFVRRQARVFIGTTTFLDNFAESLPADINFANLVKTIKHIRTTTPHPTEFLSQDGVEILKELQVATDNFIAGGNQNQSTVVKLIKDLSEELEKVPNKKKIRDEAVDGLRGAENLYNALVATAETIFLTSQKRGFIGIKNGVVSAKDLTECAAMMEVRTWCSGDGDGKPAQDYMEFEKGYKKNREAIDRKYIIELAQIATGLEESSAAKTTALAMVNRLVTTMHHRSGYGDKTDERLLRHAKGGNIAHAAMSIIESAIERRKDSSNSGQFRHYENFEDMVGELYNLKEIEKTGIRFPKKNSHQVLSRLDSLIIGAQNFGLQAQKAEFRQNSNALRKAAKIVKELKAKVTEDKTLNDLIKSRIESFGEAEYIRVRKALNSGEKIIDEEIDNFYFMDTIEKFKIMAKNPDSFRSILIAECGEIEDKKENSTLQSISDFKDTKDLFDVACNLSELNKEQQKDVKRRIRITPLFEYNRQISELPDFVEGLIKDPEVLKYFQEHGLEIMIAGSDSFKSASSSVTATTKDSIARLKDICERNRVYNSEKNTGLTIYYGTGSNLGRNIVNLKHKLPFLRTIQGIEMRRPCADIACEFLRVTANRLRRLKGSQRKDINFLQAVSDIGNSVGGADDAGLVATNHQRATARISEYDEKYNSIPFETFVELCLPSEIDKMFNFSARPAARVGGSADKGAKALRAIGYAQLFNNAGWGAPQLFLDVQDLITSGRDKPLHQAIVEDATRRYLKDAHFRDTINRTAHSLAHSDPDTGWQYVSIKFGLDIKVSRLNPDTFIIIDEKEYAISDLVGKNSPQTFLKLVEQLQGKYTEDFSLSAQKARAIQAAAFLEYEHQKSLRSVHALLSCGYKMHAPRNRIGMDCDGKTNITPEQLANLLARINPEMGAEIKDNRECLAESRKELLSVFKKQVTQGKESVTLTDKKSLYLSYSILRNIFELPPVALLYPKEKASQRKLR